MLNASIRSKRSIIRLKKTDINLNSVLTKCHQIKATELNYNSARKKFLERIAADTDLNEVTSDEMVTKGMLSDGKLIFFHL